LSAARHARFNNLYFNDIDPVATDALKLRLADQPVGRVRVGNVDCNDAIDEAREFLFPRSSRPRTLGLAFIDPTAYQMRFDSLERLASDGVRVDLIINFMTDFAKRFVKTDAWREGSDFDKFMGTREWLRLKTDVPLSQLNSELLAIYRKQLAKIGYEVDDRVVVRNSGDRVLYHLVYASRSRVGLKFWHEISVTDAGQQRRLPL
jgi:three-Cys-motif partner protein